ncbi:hypothetical protein SAMN03159338_1760 [Sphingomonas sp. NFR04]|nr:hypothetical protein [Sphingomonas sp. NFR04]SFJ55651.1 hypothetical protein SAMN03159338_1760 [Sphingomonas sp. NFR04]
MSRTRTRAATAPKQASPQEMVANLAVLASVFAWAGVVVTLFVH